MNNKTGLSLKIRTGYGIGDFGFNLTLNLVGFYLLFFLTDILNLSPANAGWILLIARMWGAIVDPSMGWLLDHKRLPGASRHGNKHACLLLGMIPLGVFIFLSFLSPPLDGNGRFAFSLAAYLLFTTAFAYVAIPYGALTASLSDHPADRASATAYRMAFGIIGTLVAAGATLPLVHLFKDAATGFAFIALIYGILNVLTTAVVFRVVPARAEPATQKNEPFSVWVKILATNSPFWCLWGAMSLQAVSVTLIAGVMSYFFKYNIRNEDMVPQALLTLFVAALATIPLLNLVAGKIGQKLTYLIGTIIMGTAQLAIYYIPLGNAWWIFGILIIEGIGFSAYFVSPWAMLPDTLDYSAWKTGSRPEGMLYGLFHLGFKIAFALSGVLAGLLLNHFGYLPNVDQSATTLNGIRLLVSVIPACFVFLSVVLIFLYPLSRKLHEQILSELKKAG